MNYNKEVGSSQVAEKCLSGFRDHQLKEDILVPYLTRILECKHS